jgi:hypothetical protein
LENNSRKTRNNTNENDGQDDIIDEKSTLIQNNFVIAMDNYFTMPKVINYLSENNIAVVGTARFRMG